MSTADKHIQAEKERESENYLEALKLYDEVLISYQKDKNYQKLAESLQGRVLTFKHLYLITNDWIFMLLARHDAEASLKISEKNGVGVLLASCHFRLGEIAALENDLYTAESHFKEALALFRESAAERGDYTYHLGEVQYRAGNNQEGMKNMLEGLKMIQDNRQSVDQFLANVWESGAHLRLAECLLSDDPEQARQHLMEASKIIESDQTLIIRKRQLEKLQEKFST